MFEGTKGPFRMRAGEGEKRGASSAEIGKARPAAGQIRRIAALEELSQMHSEKILRTVYRITRNREDAEDALQDSLLNAFVHIGDFDGRSSFNTWVTRIAINSALMLLRKKRNSRLVSAGEHGEPEEDTFQSVPDHAPDPEQRYLQHERQKLVRNAVGRLRPSIRKVIELQVLAEVPLKEAAELMGISVAAVKGRLFHAKAALRKSRKLTVLDGNRVRRPFEPLVPRREAA